MFTGIITDVGKVSAVERHGDAHVTVATGYDTAAIAIGASIACSGVCLTVVEKGDGWFAVDASAETLSRTTLGTWREGTRVNLERALTASSELGGHLVSGHIDGTVEVLSREPSGDSLILAFALPEWLAPYVAAKGSIALDGVSLTVNDVDGETFTVNVIPHTRTATTFGPLAPGDRVNVEIDMLARYVRRALAYAPAGAEAAA